MEVLTKQETIAVIEQHISTYSELGYMRRDSAARFLDMPLASFDQFVSRNPQLKKRNGKTIRYCPKELKAAFQNN